MANTVDISGVGAPERPPNIFEPKIRDDFSGDFPAVHHEAGHALAWLSCSGRVSGFLFGRNAEGRLGGKTEFGFPPGRVADTEGNACLVAERLLAGEVAVRLLLGADRNLICSYEVATHPKADVGIIVARLDEFLLKRGVKGRLDIRQALDLAGEAAGEKWYAWVGERLKRARQRVDDNWESIRALGEWLLPRVPAKGSGPVHLEGEAAANFLSGLAVHAVGEPLKMEEVRAG